MLRQAAHRAVQTIRASSPPPTFGRSSSPTLISHAPRFARSFSPTPRPPKLSGRVETATLGVCFTAATYGHASFGGGFFKGTALAAFLNAHYPEIWDEPEGLEAIKSRLAKDAKACCIELLKQFKTNENQNAGFHFLQVLDKCLGLDLNIPPAESFTSNTIKNVLLARLQEINFDDREALAFIDFFLAHDKEQAYGAPTPEPLFVIVECEEPFLKILTDQLRKGKTGSWETTQHIILATLYHAKDNQKLQIAKALCDSDDPKANKVGGGLLEVFDLKERVGTLEEYDRVAEKRVPHAVRELKKDLPKFTMSGHGFYPPVERARVSAR